MADTDTRAVMECYLAYDVAGGAITALRAYLPMTILIARCTDVGSAASPVPTA